MKPNKFFGFAEDTRAGEKVFGFWLVPKTTRAWEKNDDIKAVGDKNKTKNI